MVYKRSYIDPTAIHLIKRDLRVLSGAPPTVTEHERSFDIDDPMIYRTRTFIAPL